MHIITRRARGVAGMALGWAAVAGLAGAAQLLWATRRLDFGAPGMPPWWRLALLGAQDAALWGALAGVGFALALMLTTRRRAGLARLSRWRAGAWGAAVALLLPLAYVAAVALGVAHPQAGLGWALAAGLGLAPAPGVAVGATLAAGVLAGCAGLGGAVASGAVTLARRTPDPALGAPHLPSLPGCPAPE